MNMSAESDEKSVEVDTPESAQEAQAEETTVVEEQAAESEAPKPRPRKRARRASSGPRKNQPTVEQVTARFAACGRCSYFWAGYRVLEGMEGLETAVADSRAGWLDLDWNVQMSDLLHKSYGVRLDIEHLRYEGCCQECRRHFIYEATEDETEADEFRIEITPHRAK